MSFWRLYYHLVWATFQREPMINISWEKSLYAYLGHKCQQNQGYAYAINGMPDHVHLIVNIAPTIAISIFVKHLKGSSSHFITHEYKIPFQWQEGYSVFSISERNLDIAIGYVNKQKEHHQNGTIHTWLEKSTDFEDPPP